MDSLTQTEENVEAKFTSEDLAGLVSMARLRLAEYKRSGLSALVDNDTRAQEAAYGALVDLRAADKGIRWSCTDDEGNTYTGNGEFWHDVVLGTSRVAGASAYVKRGISEHIKCAGAAAAAHFTG